MNYCDTCIHKEVCGLEDNNDASMTYCSDRVERCGDCVSREAVIKTITEWLFSKEFHHINAGEYLRKRLDELPSVTPQQKMGRWISYNWNDNGIVRWGIKCDQCYKEYRYGGEMGGTYRYCPNCGSWMKGEE